MVSKKHSGKADQLTLASGGSEHALLFSVAISWSNKMNFSLCANMSGFCSDSHKCSYPKKPAINHVAIPYLCTFDKLPLFEDNND